MNTLKLKLALVCILVTLLNLFPSRWRTKQTRLVSVLNRVIKPNYLIEFKFPLRESEENMLWISNHVSYFDFYLLMDIQRRFFSKHQIIFVVNSRFSELPIFGKILENHHIPITRIKFEEESNLKDYKKKPKKLYDNLDFIMKIKDCNYIKKSIVVIFPEGTFYHENVLHLNNKYTEKNNIILTNVLHPKINGLNTLLKYYKYSTIYDFTFDYPKQMAWNEKELLNDINILQSDSNSVKITTKKINRYNKNTKEFIYELWTKKEKELKYSNNQWRNKLWKQHCLLNTSNDNK